MKRSASCRIPAVSVMSKRLLGAFHLLAVLIALLGVFPSSAKAQTCCPTMLAAHGMACSGSVALSCATGCAFCQGRLPVALACDVIDLAVDRDYPPVRDATANQIVLAPSLPPPRIVIL
jgi:hypothetical protein